MKCPKCGFNSFEFLDNCKKCNAALSPFKRDLGIRAVVLPPPPLFVTPVPGAEPETAVNDRDVAPAADLSWEASTDDNNFAVNDRVSDFDMDLSELQEENPVPVRQPEMPVTSAEAGGLPEVDSQEAAGDINDPFAAMASPSDDDFADLMERTEAGGGWNSRVEAVAGLHEPDNGCEELFEDFQTESPALEDDTPDLPAGEETFAAESADAVPEAAITGDPREKDPILDDLESLFELNEPVRK